LGHVPRQLAAAALADGSFVRISGVHLDVPLFWQCWKLESPMVKAITNELRSGASNLHQRK
jgi:LysR family transcriptional regulator (chromosome initiation inhibitor)